MNVSALNLDYEMGRAQRHWIRSPDSMAGKTDLTDLTDWAESLSQETDTLSGHWPALGMHGTQ